MRNQNTSGTAEFCAISVCALLLFLPFRAIQYDINGIQEAQYIENGQLFQKNHMLYRPVTYAVYSAARTIGYPGNALGLMQVMNAIFGAVGIGLCYAFLQSVVGDSLAALVGAFWLATSFSYWYFSTDAGYIVLAGMFVVGGMVCAVRGRVLPTAISTTLAVLTWQANIVAVPAISTLQKKRGLKPATTSWSEGSGAHVVAGFSPRFFVAVTTLLLIIATYVIAAFVQGNHTPATILHWATTYGEGLTPLPMWGTWAWNRFPAASISALRSILPILLAAGPSELTEHIQLGRIAVDIAVIAFIVLLGLAALRADRNALVFLAAYILFLPFIIWWDPYEPKWFLVPNIFLASFLAASLAPWLTHKYMRVVVLGSVLVIAGTNFITTIRPRHARLGPDREIAQCVAEKMTGKDLFVAAEWGWPEYLSYLHDRGSVNLINDGLSVVKNKIQTVHEGGGTVYMLDPATYPTEHMNWLKSQTGLTRDDLRRLFSESQAVMPVTSCR